MGTVGGRPLNVNADGTVDISVGAMRQLQALTDARRADAVKVDKVLKDIVQIVTGLPHSVSPSGFSRPDASEYAAYISISFMGNNESDAAKFAEILSDAIGRQNIQITPISSRHTVTDAVFLDSEKKQKISDATYVHLVRFPITREDFDKIDFGKLNTDLETAGIRSATEYSLTQGSMQREIDTAIENVVKAFPENSKRAVLGGIQRSATTKIKALMETQID